MARKLTGLVVALAFVAGLGPPSAAQYPPAPGADAAAAGISTASPWTVRQLNRITLQIENHGTVTAFVFSAVVAGRQEGYGWAAMFPPSQGIFLGAGDQVVQTFDAVPIVGGTFTVTGCATAVPDVHPADNCKATVVSTTGSTPTLTAIEDLLESSTNLGKHKKGSRKGRRAAAVEARASRG